MNTNDTFKLDTIIDDKRLSWGLTDQQALSALQLIQTDQLTQMEWEDDLRMFLYAKRVKADEMSEIRKDQFNDLLDPENFQRPERIIQALKAARERLRRIVRTGESGRVLMEGDETSFDQFVAKHPEWAKGKSFVAFRDHALLSGKLNAYVERFQDSGLCYMHAPIVLQHYLVAMHSNDPVPMLDMSVYLKRNLSEKVLEKRIWHDEGENSVIFLEEILCKEPRPIFRNLFSNYDDILYAYLYTFGPALVSNFEVHQDFESIDSWQHLGEPSGDCKGMHAMILIGARKEGEKFRYLMQNWWKRKAFIEVDSEYLESCYSRLFFVQTPQKSMGNFPTTGFNHVECENLDVQDMHILETSI